MSEVVIRMVDKKEVFHKLANRFIRIRWHIPHKYLQTAKMNSLPFRGRGQMKGSVFATHMFTRMGKTVPLRYHEYHHRKRRIIWRHSIKFFKKLASRAESLSSGEDSYCELVWASLLCGKKMQSHCCNYLILPKQDVACPDSESICHQQMSPKSARLMKNVIQQITNLDSVPKSETKQLADDKRSRFH